MNLKIEAILSVGSNDRWQFAVAKVGDRWLGVAMECQFSRAVKVAFAAEGLAVRSGYMHVFGEVSEEFELGMKDQTKAILLVGALARDAEQGFGGIDDWLVPEELRGDPDDFRCNNCWAVGCDGRDCEEVCGPEVFLEDEGV